MTSSKEQLINIVGPALRGLFGRAGRLPLVTYKGQDTSVGCAPHTVQLDELETPEQIVAILRPLAAKGPVRKVEVTGLGLFEIQPVDQDLAGRAAGKVAMVTGAAQGFGLEIAQDLAEQGASVILTDINEAGAAAAAKALCDRHGPGRARGLAVNVAEIDSVACAIHRTVCQFGGLDVLVSNAGVLKAGSVKTQPVKEFDFVTAVNYKGFFICVQSAASVMAVQHLACQDYRADIIQINSKSGLVGSNRNGAYAGSKFGSVGLVQSFALELVEDGIKVNAVCPGNFFDGPLWSDPQTGLFVQYLRTGKVPGAKTIEDVRRAYESKIPMGRGCMTGDVMKAIYYLIEQVYETGQALPVTGGQVMLH
jgi:sorbitol-6-phosphate 2-dehydrogenase